MSTQQGGGGTRRPSATGTGAKPTAGTKATRAEKAAAEAADRKSRSGITAAGGGKKGKAKSLAPVKVSQQKNWFPIIVFGVVLVLSVGIIGYMSWQVREHDRSFADRVADIDGITDFRKKDPKMAAAGQHAWGPLKYEQTPPVGGTHNYNWQNCMGDVYDAQIASEHAVHSLEHGAVWITYNPDKVDKGQIDALAKKVRNQEYMMLSPFPGQEKPISLQAWGYQLTVDKAADERVDAFIKTMRKEASIEPGATCSGGITEPGTTPRDLGKDQPQQPTG